MEIDEIHEIHEIHETHGNQFGGYHLVLSKYRAKTLFPESRGGGPHRRPLSYIYIYIRSLTHKQDWFFKDFQNCMFWHVSNSKPENTCVFYLLSTSFHKMDFQRKLKKKERKTDTGVLRKSIEGGVQITNMYVFTSFLQVYTGFLYPFPPFPPPAVVIRRARLEQPPRSRYTVLDA